MTHSAFAGLIAMFTVTTASGAAVTEKADRHLNLVFSCRGDNDLYQVVAECVRRCPRHATPSEAIRKAPPDAGVLILADGYPYETVMIGEELLALAAEKRLRLYVEYPSVLADMEIGQARSTGFERGVVTSPVFGEALAPMRVLTIHGCHFVPVTANAPHIVLAKVAGYDRAVFGLPEEGVHPLLFEHPRGDILVATTKLSQFVTARYGPQDAWKIIWRQVMQWLLPEEELPPLEWTPTVRPTYGPREALPEDVEQQALRRATAWFGQSRLFIHPAWKDQYDQRGYYPCLGPAPERSWPVGDGSLGMLEGFGSRIHWNGKQPARWMIRADCNSEAAMAMAFAAIVNRDKQAQRIARNLLDFVYFKSPLSQGPRSDPRSDSFGLLGFINAPSAHFMNREC